jgi:glycerol-3-phosphate dehydrogenase (NAD(P)+)
MLKVSIIGTTSWGITLGVILARKGLKVGVLARTAEECLNFKNTGENSTGYRVESIPSNLFLSTNPREVIFDSRAVILAVPSQTMRSNIQAVSPYLNKSMAVVSASKGLELSSGLRMSQVIASEIDQNYRRNICALSGPNLAREILSGLPAATVAASEDEEVRRTVQRLLTTPDLCVYVHNDVIGVELGGAFKNIIALGAGIADGLGVGDNAKSAFITRGLTEISALGVAMGANPLTFSGLAGLGDLMATCSSTLSRNHYVGVELAKNRPLEDITSSMDSVAEGVTTTRVAWDISQKMGISMPITEKIYRVLYEGLKPSDAASELMNARVDHELTGRRWRLSNLLRMRKKQR